MLAPVPPPASLFRHLAERAGHRVLSVVPVRTAWRIETEAGEVFVKRLRAEADDRLFVTALHDHLAAVAPGLSPRVGRLGDGAPYLEMNGDAYLILESLSGRQADYLADGDLRSVAAGLAGFHRAARGYRIPGRPGSRVLYGRWPVVVERRLADLHRFRAMAGAGDRCFDREYLALWPAYARQALGARAGLDSPEYRRLSTAACIARETCHHDLAHHNVLLDGEQVRFVDLDYAVADTVLHDLTNLAAHILRLFHWRFEPMRALLTSYWRESRPPDGALFVLGVMLLWPQDFWQLGRQYYDERQAWPEERFLELLARKCGRPGTRLAFLRRFWREHRLAGPLR